MFLTLVQPVATAPVTPERFGELFEQHADSVYNFCFRRLSDWAMAEDMTWRCSSRPGGAETGWI